MNLSTLRARLRKRLDDETLPYFLSDAEVDDIINEAYEQACIRARLLRNRHTLTTTIGVADYSLYALIPTALYITRIEHPDGYYLERTSLFDLRQRFGSADYGTGTPSLYALDGEAGESGTLRLFPTPNAALDLVIHYTAVPDRLEADTDEPAIPVHTHPWLIYGALSIAYENHDVDVLNREDQVRYETLFERRFGPLPSALETNEEQTRGWPVVIPC